MATTPPPLWDASSAAITPLLPLLLWDATITIVGCQYTQYYCYWWDATIAIVGCFLCCHTTCIADITLLLILWDASSAAITPPLLPLHPVILLLLLRDATIVIVGCFHCYCYCYFWMPLLLSWDATIATIASLFLLLQSVLQ